MAENNGKKLLIGFIINKIYQHNLDQKDEPNKTSDMSKFRITYDGPTLQTSQMDVNELAPTLLAMGDLLTAATIAPNDDKVQRSINVKASFKTGSFGIDFVLDTGVLG